MSNQTQQHDQQAGQAFSQDEFSALLNKEFRPKTDQARSAVESAVKTLAQQALENTVTFSNDTYRTIQNLIAGIDEQLSQQVNQIIHHEEFQKLESAWRGLSYLVNNTETDEMLKIRFMSISKQELGRTLKRYKGVGWDQSPIFKKIYEQEYGQFGGEPFGCIVGDYYFDHSPQDVELLGEMARIGSAAHCPFITGTAPGVMQMESWQELANPRDLTKIFQNTEYAAWRSLRESEDARYLGLVMPRFRTVFAPTRWTASILKSRPTARTTTATPGQTLPMRWRPTSTAPSKSTAGAPRFAAWNPAGRWKTCRATPSQAMTAAWT